MKKILFVSSLLLLLAACSSTAPQPPAPGVKLGKPYSVDGETYYPQYDPSYDETGVASWYGPGFHGKYTANGEKYDQNAITAAHPTLPLPSLVRVTNLDNGKTAVIRINDRGPFKDRRIIDLSKGSAKLLGVTSLAKVRVQLLKDETEQYWANMNINSKDIETAGGAPSEQAAPVVSVASNDVQPVELKVRPIPPRFTIVGDAQADDTPPPVANTANDNNPSQTLRVQSSYKPSAKVVHVPEEEPEQTADEAAGNVIDTSSEYSIEPVGEEPPPRVASVPREVDRPSWYVQAGAFASLENARKLAKRLKSFGETAIADMASGGRTLHRVRIGPFASKDGAMEALEGAIQAGASGAKILKE